ncbi:MAG: DEAD/DEAH box helicase [Caldisphaeraceae archaeon]|nr:DEAD/DEAH box helicase [Caldisphaeraceae archaeon]
MKEETKKLMSLIGYNSLFPPQELAIKAGIEEGENVLVASPTASGKTFIAMVAILNSLKRGGGKAVYTSPLRSVAYQKYREFKILEKFGYSTRLSIGDFQEGPPKAKVWVTTYERLDSIIRNDPEALYDLGTVVVDEIHYVDDEKRGPVVETLISKILQNERLQIVALSATIPNSDEVARWLNARLVHTSWRPVPLYEGIYKDGLISFNDGKEVEVDIIDTNPSINLVIDASKGGGQVLVFSQSRRKTVSLAKRASKYSKLLKYDKALASQYAKKVLKTSGPKSLREEIAGLMAKGVSYHHAGLSNEQRSIIEEAFARNALSSIFATPTLAAGVNLPARRVVVDEYYRFERGFRTPIKVSEYKQLAGRAGRPGLDPYGEAIIVASKSDEIEDLMNEFINGSVERVESRLSGLRGFRHSVLGAVSSRIANTKEKLLELHKRTLYYLQRGETTIERLIKTSLRQLEEWGLINHIDNRIVATRLGHVVSRTYLNPESIPIIQDIVKKAKNLTESTLLYMISSMPDINPLIVSRSEEDKVLNRVIEDSPELIDVVDFMNPEEAGIIKTMYVLKDWINELPEDKIAESYRVGPGDVASLIDTAAWIARSLAEILQTMDIGEGAEGLRVLERRIRHGVKVELLQLVSIPEIGRVRARRLYNSGYKSLSDLSKAEPKDLLRIKGIGPYIAIKIMEYFGREEEAKELKKKYGEEESLAI